MLSTASALLALFDGDRARDWSPPGHPIRPEQEIRDVMRKFRDYGIEFHVLDRYAIENYFPQAAYEKVMGDGVSKYFPLDPARSVESQIPGYDKDFNGALAEATELTDLAGTDLERVLDNSRRRLLD